MPDQQRINGNVFSYASIVIKKDGQAWHGWTSISYGQKRERTKLWGTGKHGAPRGRTSGKYTPDEVSLKGAKGTVRQFIDELARSASDQKSYGNVEFVITVQYIDTGEVSITDELQGCVIVGEASSHEEGADPLTEEIKIDCMRIVRNGKTLFDSSVSRSV